MALEVQLERTKGRKNRQGQFHRLNPSSSKLSFVSGNNISYVTTTEVINITKRRNLIQSNRFKTTMPDPVYIFLKRTVPRKRNRKRNKAAN